jgi:hypothetical protein
MFNDITDIKKAMKLMHEELLEVIQTLSDASTDSDKSSVCTPCASIGPSCMNNPETGLSACK